MIRSLVLLQVIKLNRGVYVAQPKAACALAVPVADIHWRPPVGPDLGPN